MKTKLTKRQYQEGYKRLIKKAEFDLDFFILMFSATVICVMGLMINNLAIIIGSMIISPLLYSVIAISVALLEKHFKTFFSQLLYLLMSVLIVVLTAGIIAFMFPVSPNPLLVNQNYQDYYLFYFIIAFFSGLAGTFCFFWPKIISAFTGIAISIALLPPFCMLGISLATGLNTTPTLIIVCLNILGIILGSVMILFFIGKRS
ncbi:MAG: DUF389 domain-containing protein [Candidatus Moranbacteria bacterium]|nr:DUF389 domain-containing protein [Candidatus Moranbacteria bacterium]